MTYKQNTSNTISKELVQNLPAPGPYESNDGAQYTGRTTAGEAGAGEEELMNKVIPWVLQQ